MDAQVRRRRLFIRRAKAAATPLTEQEITARLIRNSAKLAKTKAEMAKAVAILKARTKQAPAILEAGSMAHERRRRELLDIIHARPEAPYTTEERTWAAAALRDHEANIILIPAESLVSAITDPERAAIVQRELREALRQAYRLAPGPEPKTIFKFREPPRHWPTGDPTGERAIDIGPADSLREFNTLYHGEWTAPVDEPEAPHSKRVRKPVKKEQEIPDEMTFSPEELAELQKMETAKGRDQNSVTANFNSKVITTEEKNQVINELFDF